MFSTKSIGGKPPAVHKYLISHLHTFNDHTDNTALMVYRGPADASDPASKPLPALFSFQVYVTAGTNASTTKISFTDLIEKVQMDQFGEHGYRLDVYFLPGASRHECAVHYAAERAARAGQTLAVLPESYMKLPVHQYHDLLFMVEDEDWATRGLIVFEFTPPTQEEFQDNSDDPLLMGEEKYRAGVPIAGDLPRTVAGMMYEFWHALAYQKDLGERYQEAVEEGREEW